MNALPLRVPSVVISGVRRRWPDRVEEWVRAAETELPELCTKYDAKLRTVFPARYGFVIAADTPDGGIVLRSSPDPNGPLQAEVAATLATLGVAPEVYAIINTETGTWTILDEVRPGTSLTMADHSTVALDALVATLTPMRNQSPPTPDMPSIFDWLRERLEDDRLADLAPNATIAPN